MGYRLPVEPIQSQIYANRLNDERYDFAYIDRVQKVNLEPEFMEQYNRVMQQHVQIAEEGRQTERTSKLPPEKAGFTYPNPVNLSPVIARVTGKGNAVNQYV